MKSVVRTRLLASTLLVGAAAIANPAFAQRAGGEGTSPGANAQGEVGMTTSEATPSEENSQGDIVVTGSLIKNPNLIASAPVTVVGQEEIQLRQSNTAEQILRDLPGAVPSIGSAVNNGNGGSSYVDLRGLGSFRNVVLLDGNRLVPSGLVGRVDLNNIPLALVERVDVLTGGAATTYGADAVSGVVNFITRSDFAGVEASASEQITEKGDGNYLRADVTIGANFDDGRGNAVFSVGYQQADPVYQGARDFSFYNIDGFAANPAAAGSGTAVPSTITGTRPFVGGAINTVAPFTQTGVTTIAVGTTPAGTPILVANPLGAQNGAGRQIDPTTGQAVAAYAPFNFNPYNIFQTPFTRYNMYGAGHYDISDSVQIYTRGLFSKNTVQTIIAPSGDFGTSVTLPLSNPYLPTAVRNQLCAFNVAPSVNGVTAAGTAASGQVTYVPRFTQAQCDAAATAVSPTLADGTANPNFRTVTVNLSRRSTEVGPRIANYVTTIFDYKAGVKVKLADSLSLDLSGSYGESENSATQQGYTLNSRFRAAVYATSTTSCLASGPNRNGTAGTDNVAAVTAGSGCVPVNIFGPDGSITANQIPYLTAESTTVIRTSLAQARGVLNGDFGTSSPFASDPIGFAVGGEYRLYKAQQRADSLAQAGDLGGAGSASPNIDGGYEVTEGFGELIAPLVQDKPGFQSLTLEAGARYSHYRVRATTAPTYNTTTYKAGGSWEPVDGIKLRGNYQRAVRAPNINELFAPQITGLTSLATDPCAGAAPTTNANLRAVCLAQGAPATTIGSILNPTAAQANATSGGNLNIKPEKSDSYTLGVVLQPKSFIPGLSITVDYYNIKVKGAVSNPTPGDVIAACFNTQVATSAACTSIRRNPVTGGLDGDQSTTPGLPLSLSNLGKLKTDGVDLGINYRRDLGFVGLNLSFQGNYTHDSKFQATPTALNRECTGFYSVNCASIQPKFYWNARSTFTFDNNIDLSVLWRHIDGVKYEPAQALAGGAIFSGVVPVQQGGALNPFTGTTVNFNRIPSYNYIDLSGRFGLGENFDMTVTVSNLFDKEPPIVGAGVGSTSYNSGNTYPSTYDALGRRFAIGGRLKF